MSEVLEAGFLDLILESKWLPIVIWLSLISSFYSVIREKASSCSLSSDLCIYDINLRLIPFLRVLIDFSFQNWKLNSANKTHVLKKLHTSSK